MLTHIGKEGRDSRSKRIISSCSISTPPGDARAHTHTHTHTHTHCRETHCEVS
eukprot:10007_6